MTPEETDAIVGGDRDGPRRRRAHRRRAHRGRGRPRRCLGRRAGDAGLPDGCGRAGGRPPTGRRTPGALCFGPDRARKVTYTHPRRWTGDPAPVDADGEAVSWAIESYLRSYGPATPASSRGGSDAPPAWADRADGGPRWPRARRAGRRAGLRPRRVSYDAGVEPVDGVRLLPYFDAYVVGSRPRHLLFPGRAAERALRPRARPATTRCCSSTVWSRASGTRSVWVNRSR